MQNEKSSKDSRKADELSECKQTWKLEFNANTWCYKIWVKQKEAKNEIQATPNKMSEKEKDLEVTID